MSTAAPLQNARAKPLQSAGASPLLQRKCACGAGASGLTGECEECGKKKMRLQTKLRINDPGASPRQQRTTAHPTLYRTSDRTGRYGARQRRPRNR
jgi:hypothetical protein